MYRYKVIYIWSLRCVSIIMLLTRVLWKPFSFRAQQFCSSFNHKRFTFKHFWVKERCWSSLQYCKQQEANRDSMENITNFSKAFKTAEEVNLKSFMLKSADYPFKESWFHTTKRKWCQTLPANISIILYKK